MDIILNQIAIWRPCGAEELNLRISPAGQKYRMPGGAVYQIAKTPLYRYAKDYEIEDVKFCLFVRTISEGPVEIALDYYAQKITKEQALKASANSTHDSFEYTPYVLMPDKSLIEEAK